MPCMLQHRIANLTATSSLGEVAVVMEMALKSHKQVCNRCHVAALHHFNVS